MKIIINLGPFVVVFDVKNAHNLIATWLLLPVGSVDGWTKVKK